MLEGIALKADPDYSIVQECFPYLSRRLLTDSSDHSRLLLRQMLYSDQGRLDVRRLQRFAAGFKKYSTQPAAQADEPPQPVAGAAGAGGRRPAAASQPPSPAPAYAFGMSEDPSTSYARDPGALRSSRVRRRRRLLGQSQMDPSVKDALKIVFSRQGTYVQELLVEELVAAIDALSREAVSELVR